MKTIYQSLQQYYGKLTTGIGLCALGVLYSCSQSHQLGVEPGEAAEAAPAMQESEITRWLPEVRPNPHNEEHVYCEVPNLSGSNTPEVNIASAMSMARVVQKSKGIRSILITNYTHLQENRDNEIQYLETQCSNLFGSIDKLRRYQNYILVGINQAPPQTRLNDMRTWFKQMGSPTMHILANRIFLHDPLNHDINNPDFWSSERFNEEAARIPCIPKAMAANLYRTMLSDNDKVVLQRNLNHKVAAVRSAITQSDYTAVDQHWDFIKKGRTVYPHAVVALSAQELLSIKLNKRTIELDTVDSAAVVHYCAELGDQNAAAYSDKNAIAVLGETGSGKSTATNYWMGRDMVRRTPEEMEAMGIQEELEDVVIVDPNSEQPEATSIGHGMVSHTLMPQMVQDPNQTTRIYIDCPGFSDNRGAEINIANAINIRKILRRARSVKTIFLVTYYDFKSKRAEGIQAAMEKICVQMFGSVDNLRRHQNSVLLGINRAPERASIDKIRARLTRMGATVQILAQRAFLYDPLEQGGADFWSRERFLTEVEQMPAIPQQVARNLFQTVLTNDDRSVLQDIVENQVEALNNALEQSNYPAAKRCWGLLNQLQIIEHQRIDKLMEGSVKPHMRNHADKRSREFSRHAAEHQFTEAEQILTSLRTLNTHFPDEHLVDLEALEATLQTARAQLAAQQMAEEGRQQAEEKAKKAEEEAKKERSAREGLSKRIDDLERALAEERRRGENQLLGAVITGCAHVVGKAIEKKD